MAIVLVAAVVVPLAVIPGTFGFRAWPSSHGDRIGESRVQQRSRIVEVAVDGPARAATPERSVVAARKPVAKRFPTVTAPEAARQRSGTRLVAMTPGVHADGSGPGQGNGSDPRHTSSPGTPSVPASESEPPAGGQTGGDQVASGDSSVLRDDQPATPAAPESPVQPVAPAPVTPVAPAPVTPVAPAPAQPAGDDCDGEDDGDAPVGPTVHGIGRHLGFGHRGR